MAQFDLTDIVQRVHRTVELDTDYPTSGDDDFTLITGLTNDWIQEWKREKGVKWNELWTEGSFTSTGATSYTLKTSPSPNISNMEFPGGFVYLDPGEGAILYWEVIKPEDVQLHKDTSDYVCWFTGNPNGGFTLNFNPNVYPASGGTIYFPYYKKATELSSGTDTPEMSDPMYLVHGVASSLLGNDDPSEAAKHFQIAQDILVTMKINNLAAPWYQTNNVPSKGSGFGV